jgi:uncharacterized protein DUF4436
MRTTKSWLSKPRVIGVIAVIVLIAAYVSTIAVYSHTACGCPHQVTEGQPAADGTTVTIDLQELQSMKGALNGDVTIAPGPGLLDPVTRGLKEDLTIAVHSAVTPTKRTWSKGVVPGVFPVSLTIAGDPSDWPFDTYHSGPVTVDLVRGGAQVPERVPVTFVDRVPGWRVEIPSPGKADVPEQYRVTVYRSPSTAVFASVILVVMVALAGIGLFVAVQTARNRRKFQPPMTTWYAAMLFAVMPLRNALPDSPPIGSWIDVTVVLWVIVLLVSAMLLYINCWWRHLRPDAEQPAPPAAVPVRS